MELSKGELVEWVIQDRNTLIMRRTAKSPAATTKSQKLSLPLTAALLYARTG